MSLRLPIFCLVFISLSKAYDAAAGPTELFAGRHFTFCHKNRDRVPDLTIQLSADGLSVSVFDNVGHLDLVPIVGVRVMSSKSDVEMAQKQCSELVDSRIRNRVELQQSMVSGGGFVSKALAATVTPTYWTRLDNARLTCKSLKRSETLETQAGNFKIDELASQYATEHPALDYARGQFYSKSVLEEIYADPTITTGNCGHIN